MSEKLRRYLVEAYYGEKEFITGKVKKDLSIQIDDQDDNDDLNEFCNLFVTVGNRGHFEFEVLGHIPLSQEIVDLAEIYGGFAETTEGRTMFRLDLNQIEVLMDLAKNIRKTSQMGNTINNQNWPRISSRMISSIYRFVRIIKEYTKIKGQLV
jgi:hypothetical protein